ncbi:E3 ubiquitin-protein ligase FANCL [Ciona intestinalis]
MNSPIALNSSKTVYDGFVKHGGKFYRLQVRGEAVQSSVKYRVCCDWKLRHILHDHLPLLNERLQSCVDVTTFISDVKTILGDQSVHHHPPHCYKHYGRVLKEVEEVGWDKLNDISEDFKQIKFQFQDKSERWHYLGVKLNDNYPQETPEFIVDLPCPFIPVWASGSNMMGLCQQFIEVLDLYQSLWDMVDELKDNCWVLEPEQPNYASTSFRIALEQTTSMVININPLHPDEIPDCKFLGSETSVAKLEEKYEQGYHEWSDSLSIYQNIHVLFNIDFHKPPNTSSMETNLQCGICYGYRLGTQTPTQVCNDDRCNQIYHHDCLVQWLQSIPGVKRSFGIIFGECPYCSNNIKIKILQT